MPLHASELCFITASMMCHMQILLPGGHTTADMPLLFIDIQYLSDLTGQCGVDLYHSVGTVLMYRTLAYPKSCGCLPYGRLVFNDIMCYFNRPFFNVILQVRPPKTLFLQCMRGWVGSMRFSHLNGYHTCSIFPLTYVSYCSLYFRKK